MQETAISWTSRTWNYIHGCSKVSDGCARCYAMELSLKRGWTEKPWTLQNEAENVMMKPHKLVDVFGKDVNPGDRIFVNSMSDMFHRAIPDWYKAVGWALMLSRPDLTFQILTKRPEATIDWPERFHKAVMSDAFYAFMVKQRNRKGRWASVHKALNSIFIEARLFHANNVPLDPWADHIWMGTSVEDARVLDRIDHLRQSAAAVKFISAEPLLGPWPADTDLTGIHWVIVGGESGTHMEPGNGRWMKQEWARGIRDLCLDQGVAYFYKQDSAKRTEVRTALQHGDGDYYTWQQYPGRLSNPQWSAASGKIIGSDGPMQDRWNNGVRNQRARYYAQHEAPYAPDYDLPWDAYEYDAMSSSVDRLSPIIDMPHDKPMTTYRIGGPPQVALQQAVDALNTLGDTLTRHYIHAGMPVRAVPEAAPPHTLIIHTAQMGVDDPDALDITVKSATDWVGKFLTPSWDIVMGHKRGDISDDEYTSRYKQMLRERYAAGSNTATIHHWLRTTDRVVLKCYCREGKFCHRHIAAQVLQSIGQHIGVRVLIGDEITRPTPQPKTEQPALL
jgi:protein gp37